MPIVIIESFWSFLDNRTYKCVGFYILDFCKICNQSISLFLKNSKKILLIGIQRDNQFHRIQNMDVLGDIVYFFCSEINKKLRKILGYSLMNLVIYS